MIGHWSARARHRWRQTWQRLACLTPVLATLKMSVNGRAGREGRRKQLSTSVSLRCRMRRRRVSSQQLVGESWKKFLAEFKPYQVAGSPGFVRFKRTQSRFGIGQALSSSSLLRNWLPVPWVPYLTRVADGGAERDSGRHTSLYIRALRQSSQLSRERRNGL